MLYWLWLSAAGLDKISFFLCKENTVGYFIIIITISK